MAEDMDVDDTNKKSVDTSSGLPTPWLEKYRPIDFADIIGNKEAIGRFEIFSQKGNIPNVILSGPPGVGKTTTILALARNLLGANYKEAVLELNASNERGIDVVRNKIKMFAQTRVTLGSGKHKIIILDEADAMTEGAQQALRRTMEVYSKTTRFALACNTSEKIIEPIQSRCAVIRFTKLNDQQIGDKLKQICKKEDLDFNQEGIDALVFTAQGDMRQAINNLQSTADGFGHISSENVFKVCDEPHPLFIKDILKNCLENNIEEALKIVDNLYKMGYSCEDIITNMFRVTKSYPLAEYLKLSYVREIGITHMRVAQGVNSLLQLSALVARLCKVTIDSDQQ